MARPMKDGGEEKNFSREFKYYKNIFFFGLFSVSFFFFKNAAGCPLAIAN